LTCRLFVTLTARARTGIPHLFLTIRGQFSRLSACHVIGRNPGRRSSNERPRALAAGGRGLASPACFSKGATASSSGRLRLLAPPSTGPPRRRGELGRPAACAYPLPRSFAGARSCCCWCRCRHDHRALIRRPPPCSERIRPPPPRSAWIRPPPPSPAPRTRVRRSIRRPGARPEGARSRGEPGRARHTPPPPSAPGPPPGPSSRPTPTPGFRRPGRATVSSSSSARAPCPRPRSRPRPRAPRRYRRRQRRTPIEPSEATHRQRRRRRIESAGMINTSIFPIYLSPKIHFLRHLSAHPRTHLRRQLTCRSEGA